MIGGGGCDSNAVDHMIGKGLQDVEFIVDNTAEDWKALQYVREWCAISSGIDIATGHLEVGAFLALDGAWQTVDKIRLLVGGETSRATADAGAAAPEEAGAHCGKRMCGNKGGHR